jgi:hypothetical protein
MYLSSTRFREERLLCSSAAAAAGVTTFSAARSTCGLWGRRGRRGRLQCSTKSYHCNATPESKNTTRTTVKRWWK